MIPYTSNKKILKEYFKEAKAAAAKIATTIVIENGGFINYDMFDIKASEAELLGKVGFPELTFAGWGDIVASQQNQYVLAAHAAVELGMLEQVNGGYKIKELDNGKDRDRV